MRPVTTQPKLNTVTDLPSAMQKKIKIKPKHKPDTEKNSISFNFIKDFRFIVLVRTRAQH